MPLALSRKRAWVEPSGSVFEPMSSSMPPWIESNGLPPVSKSPAAFRSTPPEMEMKKTRPSVELDEEAAEAGSWSISLRVAEPAAPWLPAVSCQLPATNETWTTPGVNWPVR